MTQDRERAILRSIEADSPVGYEDLELGHVAHAWDMFRVFVGPDDARIVVPR